MFPFIKYTIPLIPVENFSNTLSRNVLVKQNKSLRVISQHKGQIPKICTHICAGLIPIYRELPPDRYNSRRRVEEVNIQIYCSVPPITMSEYVLVLCLADRSHA